MMNREHKNMLANARRAQTIANREQERGQTDLSVKQTVRMAKSCAAAQNAVGRLRRESIHLYHRFVGVLCSSCPESQSAGPVGS